MSKFVSGGTIDKPIERDEEWRKAQEEVEENFRRKAAEGEQHGGKSLYEVLEANKAAKQEAFEESIRLKNQFRSLDDDEVDFLDKVLESTRAKEAAVRKETSEQLDSFRRQQEEAERSARLQEGPVSPPPEEQWATGRKRKKGKEAEGLAKGLKLRKTSSAAPPGSTSDLEAAAELKKQSASDSVAQTGTSAGKKGPVRSEASPVPKSSSPKLVSGLGLGDYSSDDDDGE